MVGKTALNKERYHLNGGPFQTLVCLANQTGVDLNEAVNNNFAKKTARDANRHKKNPKLLKD